MELTERKPLLFTNKALVALVIPIILEAILSIVAGTVDSAMVSSAGEAAVSAVSLVDSINLLFLTVFLGFINGGSVITSQYIGKRDNKQACVTTNQILYLSTAVATAFMVVLVCLHKPFLRLIYTDLEPIVFQNCCTYFVITLLGYPFFSMGATSTVTLRAMGRTRQAVVVTTAYNVLNVIGNTVLIYGFHMGVAGAALATTISRVVYAAVGLWLGHNKSLPAHLEKVLKFRLDFDVLRRVFRIGIVNGTENGMFHVGKIMISSLLSTFGTVAIAAYSTSFTLNNIGWTIVSGFSTAMLPVVGQCIGAGEEEQAKLNIKKLVGAGTVVMLVVFSGIFFFRDALVRIYDFEEETLKLAAYYTAVCAIASVGSLYSFSFAPASGFRAAGDIRFTMIMSTTSMFAFRVGMCFVVDAIWPAAGPMAIFIGMWADWAFRSIVNIFRYRSGKWIHKRLV